MEADDRPPGRPPDPNLCKDRSSSLHNNDTSYSPILTAPLSSFESIEASQRRKRVLVNENEDISSAPKQQRHLAPSRYSRTRYSALDLAPFIVHVSRSESDPSSGTSLHPIKFGQLLQKLNFNNVLPDGIKKLGRNRISVQFKTPEDANAFLANTELNNMGYLAVIPSYNITRMGIVRGVPSDWSDEEVVENIKIPAGCGAILKIRRINHKISNNGIPEWKPTSSVVLTFDGQSLPKRVFCCYNSLPVDLYYFPTIQCFACSKYGHTKIQCRSKPRCYRCGGEHLGEGCTAEDMNCFYCSGPHSATSKQCPEFVRQKNLKVLMAENNISYAEAAKMLPPVSKSYADVSASSRPSLHTSLPNSASQKTRPIPSSASSSSSSASRKTVISQPRTRTPPIPGYDKRSHNEIINSYSFSPSSSNGCALNSSRPRNDLPTDTQTLVLLLTTLLSKINIPDHVATNIIDLIVTHHNGYQDTTMECQKCPT